MSVAGRCAPGDGPAARRPSALGAPWPGAVCQASVVLVLAIACTVSAAAWVYLVAAHGGFWLTSQRLPPAGGPVPGPRVGGTNVAGMTDGVSVAASSGEAAGSGPQTRGAPRTPGVRGTPGTRGMPVTRGTLGAWPAVAAVVPARNEAESLPVTLPALLAQEYPGAFRVFLVDDNSEDGTGAIAAELGDKAARDGGAPLTLVVGGPRPAGWAGKVWAMAQGYAAVTGREAASTAGPGTRTGTARAETSAHASGFGAPAPAAGSAPESPAAGFAPQPEPRYVLFTDADIAWGPRALRDLVRSAEDDDRDLVSQMALLRAETGWERAIVPAFVYFFAQLYPFRRVNAPGSGTAAAAGGCMLVRKTALDAAGGLERIRGALIDDVALGTLLKKSGSRTWLGLTTDIRSARPYPSLASLWHMVARSAYVQLGYNPLLLAGTIVGLLLLYVAPPAGLIAGLAAAAAGGAGPAAAFAGAAGLAGWALMTASFVPMLRFYRLSPLRAPALPLIAALYAAMTADSARRHYRKKSVSWRGRAAARL